jgi:hypothetical protein
LSIRRIPACCGASFSVCSPLANCDAAWAPTWAIRKDGEGRPVGLEQAVLLVCDFFMQPIIAYVHHSTRE